MSLTLITTPTFGRYSSTPWDLLRDAGVHAERPRDDGPLPRADLLDRVPAAEALIVGLDPIDRAVFEAAPRLKVVAKHGVGYDNIDLDAARDHGVRVVYAPGSNSRAVAELTFGLLLDVARGISANDRAVRAGGWPKTFGVELAGRSLGVVGFGRIGRLMAGYAAAFGMTVVAHDPFVPADGFGDVTSVDLDAAIDNDVVSLHLPAVPGSGPLLDRTRLESMRPGAILLNAARGGLVDEAAAAELLHSGHLAGAGFDAFAVEPIGDSPLSTAPNVVLTAHIGACSREANKAMGIAVVEGVLSVLGGGEPRHSAF
ncbi:MULTISPECIES: phosphoglycerate dehydrogenase [Actinoalloteichus]|uniref:Phosphoglycerate dehydrogenase-like oxidoreductase n=1 Tax=Actinoalloteichus fjordicus TaxID=1612552 RepID=A0AAC9L7G0_9PSEU|nr:MULTISPECIES: phosphoglycerate dehydrogenase [Actinoalloteichus]APU12286.1 phosphoglycerate dehydrogenase-like oxidoreductase [Actinoalloteichus fjordicus]APU18238.1 phosphoglycerate dehydrogenase-like oxidoreductase [Actinoalloteichus sp. GBA129-24]